MKQGIFLIAFILLILPLAAFAITTTVLSTPNASSWITSDSIATVLVDSIECPAEYSCMLKISDTEQTCPQDFAQYDSASPATITQTKWVCGAAKDIATDFNYFSTPLEFKVDKVAPTTTANAGTYVFGSLSNSEVTVTLTCSDGSGSGCATINQCTDNTDSCTPSTAYSAPFAISTQGTSYVRYSSNDAAGNSETVQSKTINIDSVAPAKITPLSAVTGSGAGEIVIGWTAPTDANLASYDARYSTSNITNDSEFNSATQATGEPTPQSGQPQSMTITGLSPCTNYYFAIKISDTAGNASLLSDTNNATAKEESTPPATPSISISSTGSNSVSLSWSAISDGDFKEYRIYRSGNNSWDSNTTITTISAISTAAYNDSSVSNGNSYYYKIEAIDKCGNRALSGSIGPATPQTATTPSTPSINSNISNNSWSSNNDPNFTWDVPSGSPTGYSCEFNQDSGYSLDNSSDSECDRDRTYSDRSDGTYYFHLRACNGSSCSDTVRHTIKIDTTKPSEPDNFSVSNRTSSRLLNWDDSSDSTSGVSLYRIYRGITCDIAANVKEIPSSEDSTWTDTYKPTERKTYCYKIRAVDNAGNESDAASKDGVVVEGSGGGNSSDCIITFTTDPAEFVGTGEAKVKVSSGSKKMYDVSENSWIYGVKTIDPRITGTETEKVLTYTIDKQYEGKELKLDYSATDSEDNQCLLQKLFKIDATKPTVSFDEMGNNAELKGVAKLSANAEDSGSGISEVNFYYKEGSSWKLIGKAALKDALYSADWNTNALDNASYGIKAEAKDKAGNLNESALTVILKNQKMQTEFTNIYKSSGLKALLEAANLGDAAVIDEAVQLINRCEVARKVMLKQASGGKYTIEIEITAKNNTGYEANIQLIERIPKDIAENAGLIKSSGEFEVLENDPVIKFVQYGVKEGQQIDIHYTIDKAISEAEAKELAKGNIAASFETPPILLYGETSIGKITSTAGNSGITGLANLIGNSSGIIIALLVAVIVIAVALFAYSRFSKGGAAGKEEDEGVEYYYRESLSDKIKSMMGGKNGRR